MVAFAEAIAHVDMDAFFVEVERLRDPILQGRAVLVGGTGPRGVVASASYEARARGARSAMPMAEARRLCPHAITVPPDHDEYRRRSAEVFGVLDSFSPLVEAVSVDEAFVGLKGLRLLYESPRAVADAMRQAMKRRLGLPCSVGVATSKLVAKMASRDAKPAGVLVVEDGRESDYLHPKPVRALWGVGEATHARLEELGISTIGDLASFPAETLRRRLGESLGGMLAALAVGRDPRVIGGPEPARSISVEETFDSDLTGIERLDRELLAQADRLAGRVRRAGYAVGTLHLKVRYGDFTTVTRSNTPDQPLVTATDIHDVALRLLERIGVGRRPVRLLGLGADSLISVAEPRQLPLTGQSWEEIEEAVEGVRERFGPRAVERARLIGDALTGDPLDSQ